MKTVTRTTVTGESYRTTQNRGRKKAPQESKQSQPITFWETVDAEKRINEEAKRLNMSRSAFCSLAVTLYIKSTRDIG